MALEWPPTLADLKEDLKIDPDDDRDDERLTQVLDAAIGYVYDVRDDLNFDDAEDIDVDRPNATVCLGTLRLAGRWHNRRRSPDGMISAMEFGATRVASGDSDIDRMLGIGRYAGMRFA